jgi:hypothetical protein
MAIKLSCREVATVPDLRQKLHGVLKAVAVTGTIVVAQKAGDG